MPFVSFDLVSTAFSTSFCLKIIVGNKETSGRTGFGPNIDHSREKENFSPFDVKTTDGGILRTSDCYRRT